MKIFITGAGGFLGSTFAARLHDGGHRVSGSEYSQELVDRLPPFFCARHLMPLGGEVPVEALAGQDVLIHCAYVPGRDRATLNIRGTLAIAEQAGAVGVGRQVFMSSYSARPDAVSGYGRMKHELERSFLAAGRIVLRPGLVIGPGGLCLRMAKMIAKYPLVPLPDGGRHPVPVIGIADLVHCLAGVVNREEGGSWNLAYRRQPTLRELLLEIRRVLGRSCLFVPFPTLLVLGPLRLLRLAGLDLGVDPDSLRGYRVNRPGIHRSDLGRFVRTEPELAQVVEAALAGGDREDRRVS